MKDNKLSEKEYLQKYDINKYERPSLTSDIVAFTVKTQESKDYRKLPEKKLSVLLVKRQEHPFKDEWALPGGFIKPDESLEDNAYRKLKEKAGIEDVVLSQLKVFSKLDRDPRGWVISCAFMALAEENKFNIDKHNANEKWFNIDYKKEKNNIYNLTLRNEDEILTAVIEMGDEFSKVDNDKFKIIECNQIAFELLPHFFTLTDLQTICEIVLDEKLIKANFRRKIKDLVTETEKLSEGAGHRPAKLYIKAK